ncbi:MAG: hypothetical protein V2I54_01955 [Bacteroidales bacterium]|jgi:hypothetical protein|nr:hypothetical protein [Bacteroidales bacterium]
MRIKTILTLFITVLLSLPVFSQEEVNSSLDTIYLLGGRKKVVEIKNISAATVRYNEPGSEESHTLERKQIQKIIYSTGRVEVFNKPVFMMVDEGSWKTVIVTDNKNDVAGLYERGKVDARSSAGSRSAKSAKKSATIRLQKKAANLGGLIVLITKEESVGGFGEAPTYFIEGIVYGYEPLPEEYEEKEEEK